jgi:hypothetical protein
MRRISSTTPGKLRPAVAVRESINTIPTPPRKIRLKVKRR